MATLVLGAVFKTTTNLIGNGMLALMSQREQWRLLVEDPSLAPAAVEELLRYDSPVQMAPPRVASTDIEILGRTIKEGDTVIAVIGGGNRDPQRFEAPASVDLRRPDPAPLSFGGGPHFCIGASLARIEGAAAFGALARRLPELRLADDEPRWRETFNNRGLQSLRLASRAGQDTVAAYERGEGP